MLNLDITTIINIWQYDKDVNDDNKRDRVIKWVDGLNYLGDKLKC